MVDAADYEKEFILEMLKHHLKYKLYSTFGWKTLDPEDEKFQPIAELFWKSMVEDGVSHFRNVKMPDVNWGSGGWPLLYADCIMIHHLFNDDYSEKNVNMIEEMELEGPYCFENVKVEKGDNVIDAGAFIGEWSAVAAAMGGRVFAFEPSPRYKTIIDKSSKLNNFDVLPYGLGDKISFEKFLTETTPCTDSFSPQGNIDVQMITLDEFRKTWKIRVDFIKSDVEGFERNLLLGARETLKKDSPKLAIRTYHSDEDRTLLPEIILSANPNYKIISRKKTLYAYV